MSAATITVRPATAGDHATLVSFNKRLAFESERLTLEDAVISPGVSLALAHPELCRYFVAEADGRIVGQTMVTFELTDWRNGLAYWIQSVYVVPELRGRGVFRCLYDHVVAAARQAGDGRVVRLYVDKDNIDAIATYERLGMRRAHYHMYEAGV